MPAGWPQPSIPVSAYRACGLAANGHPLCRGPWPQPIAPLQGAWTTVGRPFAGGLAVTNRPYKGHGRG
ncbi:hypothetical protein B296_00058516 [Ensete ventricosum]|uniref:Uncharacterized protein n=1 Tax=Ensete ventricosum TaxID=4639 RepID=A0A426WXV3_ENSVE|nr:hypothetical protein B296_00058516 [Ensete ventricosum]